MGSNVTPRRRFLHQAAHLVKGARKGNHEQRIAVQSVLEDETVTKPRASHWDLLEQLIAVFLPLATRFWLYDQISQ